ncbi:MAG: hypothetical protein E6370_16900 [Clostridiales bacterium]|nr:hypothetical protein [Clostridiales bacterium]
MGTLWRIRYAFEEWYFKVRYSKKQPKIYYDKWFKCHVHPQLVGERGCIEYVVSELTHSHTFEGVLLKAVEYSDTFELYLDYNEYSEQQIKLINKAKEVCRAK